MQKEVFAGQHLLATHMYLQESLWDVSVFKMLSKAYLFSGQLQVVTFCLIDYQSAVFGSHLRGCVVLLLSHRSSLLIDRSLLLPIQRLLWSILRLGCLGLRLLAHVLVGILLRLLLARLLLLLPRILLASAVLQLPLAISLQPRFTLSRRPDRPPTLLGSRVSFKEFLSSDHSLLDQPYSTSI